MTPGKYLFYKHLAKKHIQIYERWESCVWLKKGRSVWVIVRRDLLNSLDIRGGTRLMYYSDWLHYNPIYMYIVHARLPGPFHMPNTGAQPKYFNAFLTKMVGDFKPLSYLVSML